MSPHKPDPLPRKVDVDISAILIRSDELDRLGAKYEHELADIFPGPGKASREGGRLPSITTSEWASITFAIGACLIGVVCTFWTFDDLDQLTRLVYPAPDAIYLRPQLRTGKLSHVVSPKPHRPLPIRSGEPVTNPFKETPVSSDQALPLSLFSPGFENSSSPLVANGGSVAENSSVQPTGPGRTSMSENGGAVAQGPNAESKRPSKQITSETLTRHSPKSIAANKTLSVRQAGVQRIRANETALNRATMSMHSQRSGAAMLQNRGGLNSMHMQHGMGAPAAALPGLNVGLNGVGLGGGISGGGHHGKSARR